MYLNVKRGADLILAAALSVVLAPLFIGIALAIKLDSPGPIFFRQRRVKARKRHFDIMKFRTMQANTPRDVPTHEMQNPAKWITGVGKWLRKTSLDELPQIFNVLRGEMSFVGPRPALWNQFDLIAERDKYHANDIPVGITGWAQINGRDELPIAQKAKLDGEYARQLGLLMDIRCIIGTILAVFLAKGVVEGGPGSK